MAERGKRFLRGAGLLAALGVATACGASAPAGAPPRTVVDILYPPGGSLLDRLCKTDLKAAVDDRAIRAAVEHRREFQELWDAQGPAYLQAAIAEIGLPFPYREVQATLTVCLPASTSVPLVIDVKPFLPDAVTPAPAWEFSEVVFHELMHTYVSPVFARSALMKKYGEEVATVKYHLHVMAVEKMTLLKLHRPDELAVLDHEYRNGPDPAYKRAWEIVNDIEGYEPFLRELRELAAATPGRVAIYRVSPK